MSQTTPKQSAVNSAFARDETLSLLVDASLVFYAIYIVVVGFDVLPPRLLDPLWILSASSALVNAVSIPLAGVFFTHVAALIAPMSNRIQERRRLISKLVAWAALGFVLLLPLLGFATWRGISNVSAANQKQTAGLTRTANKLLAAIEISSSTKELQARMVQLQGPQIRDEDLSQPLELVKKAEAQIVKQALNAYIAQLPKPTSDAYKSVYLQTLRTALLATVASLGFASLSWDPLKQQTLLGSILKKRRGASIKSAKMFAPLKTPFATIARFFKRSDPESLDRKRFWFQVKDKEKRASALRAKELKRNADNMRKSQRERERKRLMEERRRKRQERRDSRDRPNN